MTSPRTFASGVLALVVLATPGCDEDEKGGTASASAGATSDDATAGPGATSSPATGSGEASADTATGPPPGPEFPCASVDECYLHGDCCSCVALHRDQPTPEDCPADCDRDACEVWGLAEPLCSHSCLVKLVECDAAMVTCADAPPDCIEGEVPSVDERCWSGHCVPADLCRP